MNESPGGVPGLSRLRQKADAKNACAGPFGSVYDFYIERPWLMQAIGRVVWGIDASVLYEAMTPIGAVRDGGTIIDVPCGGGVAFRALRPGQDVRYLAGDLSEEMLARARVRALERGQVELTRADMTELPFGDEEADLFLSFSGLHMIHEPERAVHEMARCLKPGGRVVGTAFLAGGTRRARAWFGLAGRAGHALPPARREVERWLADAGLAEIEIGPQPGFVAFGALKPAGGSAVSVARETARH